MMSNTDENKVELIAGKKVRVKVCGMRDPGNLRALLKLYPDFIGFIFYDKSSRVVQEETALINMLKETWPEQVYKVGVFVDADQDEVLKTAKKYSLDYIQLHGNENVFYCDYLKSKGLKLIKAFAVDKDFSFTQATAYTYYCDYLLFDAKGLHPGGNGVSFDWSLLEQYKGATPFLLSGGIHPGLKEEILKIDHPQFIGVDINSGFETAPGMKDINKIAEFMAGLYLPDY
jgi:phosphoribosylanthranilate isomerase